MIQVTKEEARVLRKLYPEYKVARTMVQDSKRHHYYATEEEGMMRAIAATNYAAAEIVARIDRQKELEIQRLETQKGQCDGESLKE